MIRITERGYHESAIGQVLQLKIHADDMRPLTWGEVWSEFVARHPGKWAVEVYPPIDQLVDDKNVYHLWVCDECPQGLNLRG